MVHTEQKDAANNIYTAFLETCRYAILMARCQSGKTGAYNELIRLMLENGDIQRAYIICGSNDTELRKQATNDALEANPDACAAGNITVLFRQDFAETMDITNSLVVVEESHLDQTQGQEMDCFLKKHGLTMDGNPSTLTAKNAYIISVDATPYSELAALTHKETPFAKHVETLVPGAGYFGLADYKYAGLMHETFDISTNMGKFAELFTPHLASPKWAVIRLIASKGQNQEKAIKAIARAHGFNVLYNTTEPGEPQVEIRALKHAPLVNTIVIIRGRLRAGKVVPKKHISFVWEGAKSSKTDSLVQGLPGRMCGYKFGASKPHIFVPASSLNSFSNKVVKASEIERAILEYPYMIPTKATNIKKPRVANIAENGKTQCVPLRLSDIEDDDEYSPFVDDNINDMKREFCRDLLRDNIELIRSSTNYSEAQKTEIISNIDTARVAHIRYFDPSGEEGMRLKGVIEAYQNKTATSDNIYDGAEMTFIFTRQGSRVAIPGANIKHIYVIFHTDSSNDINPGISAVHLNSRVPKTTGKSIFSVNDSQTATPLVAGGVVGFDEQRIRNPAAMEAAIRDYLLLWKNSTLTVARCIQSVKDRFTLSKSLFHWESAKKNDVVHILQRLSAEFGIKLEHKYSRGSDSNFNLKTITW